MVDLKLSINDLIIRPTPKKILFYLLNNIKTNYQIKIARDTITTYSYLSKVFKLLESSNLLYREKNSRRVFVYLTDKGKKLTESLLEIEEILKT